MSSGANTHGQLGLGFKSELCSTPTVVDLEFRPETIQQIVGGGGHSVLLSQYGEVFSCGCNCFGQLGLEEPVTNFTKVGALERYEIVDVSCGWDATFAITTTGQLLAWGSNIYGQLGMPTEKILRSSVPLLPIDSVTVVSGGLRHTAVVNSEGQVLVCGRGSKGQLGLVNSAGEPVQRLDHFQKVKDLPPVIKVACGQLHTLALTFDGRLFGWGNNKHGQLGLDPTLHPLVTTPRVVSLEKLESATQILCGWTHSAIVRENGLITNWGRDTYGQLGHPTYDNIVSWMPQTLQNLSKVKQMVIGSEHNLAIFESGLLVSWGWNEHGNCGTGSVDDVIEPTPVALNRRTSLIGSGAGHSFALSED